MDTLETMKVFARVAQRSGFAAAARDLRMSPASVTKHVAALEARLGVRLLDRTTRSVSLTEAGRVYLERCLECLQSVDDADAAVTELARDPRGLLRVTAPIDLQAQLAPVVTDLARAFPAVVIELQLSNRAVDLVAEGIDVAVRVAPRLDGSYVARPLARARLALYAAPAYLRAHGHPRRPEDLSRHRAVVFAEPRPLDELTLRRDGKQTTVALRGALLTNSGPMVRSAVLDGVGIAMAPSFVLGADLAAGALEHVLPAWELAELRVHAVYPHRRFVSPKVRLFVDALRAAWGDGTADPWWPS